MAKLEIPSPAMSSDGDMERDDEYEHAGFDQDVEMNYEDDYSEASELQDEDDEGYDPFDVTSGETAPQKKPYEISYKVKSVQELQAEQKEAVEKVVGLLECDYSTAAILLRHYRWNSEKLTELFWDDPTKTLEAAGLSPPSSPSTSTKRLPDEPLATRSRRIAGREGSSQTITSSSRIPQAKRSEAFECPICCAEVPESAPGEPANTLSLGCNHKFCIDCWKEYLERKIMDEAESGRVQCMELGCGRIVGERVVLRLVNQTTADRYRQLLDRTYVDDNPTLKWCPHPNCEYAVQCTEAPPRMLDQIIPTVRCRCHRAFCFGCGLEADHRPLICKYVKLWEKKCADDSETSNWLMANTKECTKCASTIEKNGGCNHMTCKKCKYEFCWVCLADWSTHGTSWYNCNRYEEKAGVQARDAQAQSRASLERYLHYFNRWANHEQSAKLDKQLYARTEKKMEQMQESSNLTWIEVQFAKRAADVLLDARMTLKWTYAMAYYLKKCNSTTIFEDNQANLEQAVEDLSEMLERPITPATIPEIREKVTNKTAFVQKRSDIILQDTLMGNWEGRWEFMQ